MSDEKTTVPTAEQIAAAAAQIDTKELTSALHVALGRLAETIAGTVDSTYGHQSEEQRRAVQLARVALLRRVPDLVKTATADTVAAAATLGASAPEVATAAGIGGTSQVHKKFPLLGRAIRQRQWLLRNRDRLLSEAGVFIALAGRMNLNPLTTSEVGRNREELNYGEIETDIRVQMRLLADAVGWPREAAPAADDVEANAAVRRLSDLAEDYSKKVHSPRGRGTAKE